MIEFRFFGDVSADGFDQSDLEVLEHDYLALFDNEHVDLWFGRHMQTLTRCTLLIKIT